MAEVSPHEGKTFEDAVKRMEQTRPTPTQEENDKTANGEHLEKHEPDGSPEQKQPVPLTAEQHKAARDKTAAELAKAKPTPTQEENDKLANGESIETHEPDGTPEQNAGKKEKTAQAKPSSAAYETRAVRSSSSHSTHHKKSDE